MRSAALRAPPWFLLASEMDAAPACARMGAGELLDVWLPEDPELPGVNGPPATARAVAAAWAERTGGRTHCRMREAMHVLSEVRDPPRPARGKLRLASAAEHSLLVGWMQAFANDAGVIGGDQAEVYVRPTA